MARMRTVGWLALAGALLALAPAGASADGPRLRGHIGFGYGKLFVSDAPGGSLAGAAGLDLPVGADLRAGLEIGFSLLGTRTVEEGSLIAELDYSLLEVLALAHWTPGWKGPVGRLSAGPGLFSARADLQSAGAAAFEDLAVEEVAPGFALSATLITRRETHVRAGLEVGARYVALPDEDWTLASLRLVIHY